MGYLKERIKHAVRFRHKRGFGVHSPFMFNLILNVIRDKEKQFTYPEMLEQADVLTQRERKVFRLLSRLIRYLKVKKLNVLDIMQICWQNICHWYIRMLLFRVIFQIN